MKPSFQITPADVERAREIVAARVVGKSDELPERIVLAVPKALERGASSASKRASNE
jgi:hypothetical protein